MREKPTIIEIAQALNLSRNTVSKVINNKGGVSEKTAGIVKRYILQNEMPYGNQPQSVTGNGQPKYVVFTYCYETAEYFNNILSNVEETLKKNGYSLLLNIIRDNTANSISIPASLYDGTACGVISFNIFDERYWKEIISLRIPAVFIDTFYTPYRFLNKVDIVTVESAGPVHELVSRFIGKGFTSFGYVGSPYYCYSMFQRWNTLKSTLEEHGLELEEKKCILEADGFDGPDAISIAREILINMEEIPQVFIGANDLHAIVISKALQELGYRIPEDVSVVGFNNSTEAQRQIPPLSTVDAHPDLIGRTSAETLIARINNPDLPHKFILNQSDIVLRQSTAL